jgi:hypothetical protein
MVNIKDIPAEVRWEIATKAANSQSVVYDMLVRQIIGDKIDEIWDVIMTEGGKESKAVAESLGLPASNAVEIESTLDIISAIILGPELMGEILEVNEDNWLPDAECSPEHRARADCRNACSLPGLLPKLSRKPEPAVHHEIYEEDVHRRSPL